MSEIIDFESWDDCVAEAVSRAITGLEATEDPEVIDMLTDGVGELATVDAGQALQIFASWVQSAVPEIVAFMAGPKLEGGFTFGFRLVANSEIMSVSPLMRRNGPNAGNNEVSGGVGLIRRTASEFLLYASSHENWSAWRDHERLHATTPLDELVARGFVEVVERPGKGWFTSGGQPGSTAYDTHDSVNPPTDVNREDKPNL